MPTIFESVFEDALWLLPGGLAGTLTILILWWTIRRVRPGTDADNVFTIRIRVWAWCILRLGIVVGFLVWAALRPLPPVRAVRPEWCFRHGGIGPLLWAFVGLMTSRWATIPLLVRRWDSLRTRPGDHPTRRPPDRKGR